MGLSTGWIIVIVVLVFAIIISNITLLKKSNKAFEFPEGYEKKKVAENKDGTKKINKSHDDDDSSRII